jgi:hypothetical protein
MAFAQKSQYEAVVPTMEHPTEASKAQKLHSTAAVVIDPFPVG